MTVRDGQYIGQLKKEYKKKAIDIHDDKLLVKQYNKDIGRQLSWSFLIVKNCKGYVKRL